MPSKQVSKADPSSASGGNSAPIAVEPKSFSPKILEAEKIFSVSGGSYAHSRMLDVSGKKQTYENMDFSFSVITRGYFHQASFKKCNFTGARFLDCNFRNAEFSDCKFDYADFNGVRIETDEILKNLPERPNVRRELLQILRKNAVSMGDVSAGRTFVLAELTAKKEHLRRAWKQDEQYYKQKYGGFRKTSGVMMRRIGLWLDNFLWGHGEKLWRLALSTFLIFILLSGISAITGTEDLTKLNTIRLGTSFLAYLTDYFSLFLDAPYHSDLPRYYYIDWLIVILRYLSLGVFVSGLFRWLSHR